MKGSFTAAAGALVPAVKYVSRWLDAKPADPIHGGVVFEVADGRLVIGSQSELATAQAIVEVAGDAEGSFLVAGRLLDALVATLADKPITFEQHDSVIEMTAPRYKATLPAMSEKDYPTRAQVLPAVGRVEGAALMDAARRTGAVASKDVATGVWTTGVQVHFSEVDVAAGEMAYALTLIGTDKLRATRETVEWEPDADLAPIGKSFLVPAVVLLDAGDAFAGLEPVELGWREGTVSLATSSRSLVTRTIGGEYVDLGPLFAQAGQRTHTARISTKDVTGPLKRADQLAEGDYRHVTMEFSENLLVLRSATEGKGGSGEEIDIEYDGPDCSITTRSAILHAALSTAPAGALTFTFTPNTYTSVFVHADDSPAWTHLFMPIRHAR